MLGRELRTTIEIEEYEPPRLFALRAIDGPVPFTRAPRARGEAASGTTLTVIGEGDAGLLPGFAAGIMARRAEKQFRKDFERLKRCSRAEPPLDLVAHPARREVVVDDAARLHRRPHRRRADEAEAGRLQPLRELLRLRRLRVPVRRRLRRCRSRSARTTRRARAAACPPRAARARRARSRSPPRSCRGGGRCPRRRAAARRRARRSARPRRDRSPRTRARKFSRLRRIVSHESPDWKPSRQSRS